jgi:hypothetical protein
MHLLSTGTQIQVCRPYVSFQNCVLRNEGLGTLELPLHVIQTGSGAHSASYPMGIGGSFSWDKAAGS